MMLTACSGGTWERVPKEPIVIISSISQKRIDFAVDNEHLLIKPRQAGGVA